MPATQLNRALKNKKQSKKPNIGKLKEETIMINQKSLTTDKKPNNLLASLAKSKSLK